MSDINSKLPVRTEDNGDFIAKISDATVPGQQLAVDASGRITVRNQDGAGNALSSTGGSLDVNVTNPVALDSATLSALESITVQNGAGAAAVNIQDGGNSLTVDAVDLDIRDLVFATDKVDASGSVVALDSASLAALESITVQNGSGAAAVNIQDGGNSITVDAVDLDIRNLSASQDNVAISDGTDTLAINPNGSINVNILDASPGTPINEYNTVASVAGGASSTHTYTATADFTLTQIEASGSGRMRITVVVNGVTRFVQFNSTANTNMSILLSNPITITSGQTVEIIRLNRENNAQTVYSTICGYNA